MSLPTEFELLPEMAKEGRGHEAIIGLESVSVRYRAPREPIRSFKEYAIRLLQGGLKYEEFHALREVSLEIRRGEFFGIIGHNGAGKSTLLRVISKVLKPTEGRIWVAGRVAPLLELGAGFHSELTGRENVYLNGTLLGYTRAEIDSLFDEIVAFSDLGEFIDAPLRTYSTGMTVRLGFAVATAKQPEILLIDEVLSVGDEQFQAKCMARMEGFRAKRASIILVTHDSAMVQRVCDRAAWLDHGAVQAVGAPGEVISAYHDAYRAAFPVGASTAAEAPSLRRPVASIAGSPLEEKILSRDWFYPYLLPGGKRVPGYLADELARFHADRETMLLSVLNPLFGSHWSKISCLDIGCNQGYFSVAMARHGCRDVLGLDARAGNIADAELMREAYGLENLRFTTADWQQVEWKPEESYDLTLMLSFLFWLEDPIGALRRARALTSRILLIETPVAPEIDGSIDWGSHRVQKEIRGSFALLQQADEMHLPIGSLSDLSLCPGRETLLWLLEHCGFTRIEVVPPPANAYEQLATGKRLMVAAYV
jgi:ABC-2 type transport system ATP-binding protein/lipopolysaccharide transport system ATP-binding protein